MLRLFILAVVSLLVCLFGGNGTWHCTVNGQSTTGAASSLVPILPTANLLGSNQCQRGWQPFFTPRIMPAGVAMCAGNVQTCCDFALATRVNAFALEDDGCAIVNTLCLGAMLDVGCHIKCSTTTVPSVPSTSGEKSRPVICRTWARRTMSVTVNLGARSVTLAAPLPSPNLLCSPSPTASVTAPLHRLERF